jgi:hypothetical protein
MTESAQEPIDQSQQIISESDNPQDLGYIPDLSGGSMQLPGMFPQIDRPGQVILQPVDERGALAQGGMPPWTENPVLAHPQRGRGRYQNRGLTNLPDQSGNPQLRAEQDQGIFTSTDPHESGTLTPGTLPG